MFSDVFVQLLQMHQKTALQVSRDLSIPKSIVYEWKSGKRMPSADKLPKIAEYFNVSVAYLLSGHEETPFVPEGEEKELFMLLRATRSISKEDHDELLESFKKNLDIYLRSRTEKNGGLGGNNDKPV